MRVVICFDDQDVQYKNLLVTHLRAGEAATLVSPWSRADVRWGGWQNKEIAAQLKDATAVVLFLSAQLLADNTICPQRHSGNTQHAVGTNASIRGATRIKHRSGNWLCLPLGKSQNPLTRIKTDKAPLVPFTRQAMSLDSVRRAAFFDGGDCGHHSRAVGGSTPSHLSTGRAARPSAPAAAMACLGLDEVGRCQMGSTTWEARAEHSRPNRASSPRGTAHRPRRAA